jgi:hypothetical protein
MINLIRLGDTTDHGGSDGWRSIEARRPATLCTLIRTEMIFLEMGTNSVEEA